MSRSWGQFTVRGSARVEAQLTGLVSAVTETIRSKLPDSSLVALVLIGGYGRGEGGVEVVNGLERPHNNLDFLLITRSPSKELQHTLDAALDPLRLQHGVGMDLSLTSPWKLQNSAPLLVWYDMRFGHKTLLGDAEFVPGLHRFTVERILPSDIRNLMVNRATLILINRMLLSQAVVSEAARKTVIKHAIKCIIGYGDAMLFFRKAYHWSYREKQRRMKDHLDIPESFRKLYDDAMEFRFQPTYDSYLQTHLGRWMESLSELLEPIHLDCERIRLARPSLTWGDYLTAGLTAALWEQPFSLRGWARKLKNASVGSHPPQPSSRSNSLALRCCGWNGVLPLLLPATLYPVRAPRYETPAHEILARGSGIASDPSLSYLTLWGIHGDSNFHKSLQALNLQLPCNAHAL